jgi:DNA-binding IclR family transcriptional regulator
MRADEAAKVRKLDRFESYNVLVPGETIVLEPFARFANPGHLCNYSKSAIRALEALELFRNMGRRLKAREIARALEIGPSSADQLLKSLVDAGFLQFDPLTKYYWPSPRTGALARGLDATLGIESGLDRFAAEVRDDLDLNVVIAISQAASMQIVLRQVRAANATRPTAAKFGRWMQQLPIGTRVPLFGSSSGAAWLSAQPRDVVLWCIAQCRRELGALADNPEQLLATLDRIREQGHAFGGISPHNDFWGIAMPLPPNEHGTIHAIAVSAPHAELERDRTEIVDYLRGKVDELRG